MLKNENLYQNIPGDVLFYHLGAILDAKYGMLLPSDEWWEGNRALVYHGWNDILKIMINSYLDTNYLYMDSTSYNYNYYINTYDRVRSINEDLFQDKQTWCFWKNREAMIFKYFNLLPFGDAYPERWLFYSWKSLYDTNPIFIHKMLRYPICPSYYPYLSLLNDNFISNLWSSWTSTCNLDWHYADHLKTDVYDLSFLKKRQLEHHDFVVGQYYTTSMFWRDPLLQHNCFINHNNEKILGLHFYWYERYGSVEFFFMLAHADWAEINTHIWWEGWSYRTIFDSFDFTTIDDGHYIKSSYNWLESLRDAVEFVWPDKTYNEKGINTYVIKYIYADKKRYEHMWEYKQWHHI